MVADMQRDCANGWRGTTSAPARKALERDPSETPSAGVILKKKNAQSETFQEIYSTIPGQRVSEYAEFWHVVSELRVPRQQGAAQIMLCAPLTMRKDKPANFPGIFMCENLVYRREQPNDSAKSDRTASSLKAEGAWNWLKDLLFIGSKCRR